jgi:glycosyltransferase involved in cell wall biosynthesis
LRDIIEASQCGRAITNQDGEGLAEFIRELHKNPELSKRMGQNGRDYLEQNFTLPQIADQYLQVIENAKP